MNQTLEGQIFSLVTRLDKIAKKNKDDFAYSINIAQQRSGRYYYRFIAIETADRHDFVTGCGDTMELMIKDVENSIKEACSNWGYKE